MPEKKSVDTPSSQNETEEVKVLQMVFYWHEGMANWKFKAKWKMETTVYMCMLLLVTEQCLCIQPLRRQWLAGPNKTKQGFRKVRAGIKHLEGSAAHSEQTQLDVNWKHQNNSHFLQSCYLLPDTPQAEQTLHLSGELFIKCHLFSSISYISKWHSWSPTHSETCRV